VKMSKSLGNGIDPLDVRALYGTDALRYTVISGLGMGADVMLDPNDLEKSFAPGRNFVTKLWNIGRFLLTNVGTGEVAPLAEVDRKKMRLADRWILGALNRAIDECNTALGPARPNGGVWKPDELRAGLRLSEYTDSARRFVWNDLADWYLESTKSRIAAGGEDADVARAVLAHSFDAALRLLQPIVPFITDVLWRRLPVADSGRGKFIAVASWPLRHDAFGDEAEFELVREAVNAIRQLRADYAIAPGERITAILDTSLAGTNASRDARIFSGERDFIARISRCEISTGKAQGTGEEKGAAALLLSSGSRIQVALAGVIDVAKECRKAKTELEKLDAQLEALIKRLANPGFTERAPAHVVDAERQKQNEWTSRRGHLKERVSSLCGS